MTKNGSSGLGVSGLYVVAACFVAAAVLRVGDVAASLAASDNDPPAHESEQVMAAGDSEHEEPAPEGGEMMAADDEAMPGVAGQSAMPGSTPRALLDAINSRNATLDEREKRVAEMERTLEVAKKRIAVEMAALKAEHSALAALVQKARSATAEGTEHLVKIYRTMKPKKAGAIFNEMDPRVAVEFLREMKGEAASYIIANMDTRKAYAVTLLMAGRNLSVPIN